MTALVLVSLLIYIFNNDLFYWIYRDCKLAQDLYYVFYWRSADLYMSVFGTFFSCLFYLIRLAVIKVISMFYPNFKNINSTKGDNYIEIKKSSDISVETRVDNVLYNNNKYLLSDELFFNSNGSETKLGKMFKEIYELESSLPQDPSLAYFKKKEPNVYRDLVELSYKLDDFGINSKVSWSNSTNSDDLKFTVINFDESEASKNNELFFFNEKTVSYFKKNEYFKWLYKYSCLSPNSESEIDSVNVNIQGLDSTPSKDNVFFNFYIDKLDNHGDFRNSGLFRIFSLTNGTCSVNDFNSWIKDYSNLHSSYLWSLNRVRFYNKPHFDSLSLTQTNSTETILDQKSDFDVTGKELLLLVNNKTKAYVASSLNKDNSLSLNLNNKDFLDYSDKNMIFRTFSKTVTSGKTSFYALDLSSDLSNFSKFDKYNYKYEDFLKLSISTQNIKDGNWIKDYYYYYL